MELLHGSACFKLLNCHKPACLNDYGARGVRNRRTFKISHNWMDAQNSWVSLYSVDLLMNGKTGQRFMSWTEWTRMSVSNAGRRYVSSCPQAPCHMSDLIHPSLRTVEDGWNQLNDTRRCKVKSKQGLKEAGEEVNIFYLTHHCIESGIKMIFICKWKFVLQFHAENFCNGAGSFGERQCGIRWRHLLIRPVKCAQRWNWILWCSVVGRGHLTFCSYICKHILREKFGWMSGEHYKRLELDKSLSSLPALRVTEWNGGVQPCLLRSKADL